MSKPKDPSTELAVGESLVTEETDDLIVETTRTDETLFTTTYRDADSDELRLALQVDITTGNTALDPRYIDASFWTLVAGGEEYPMTKLQEVLAEFRDPNIEVETDKRIIRVYSEKE
jgi:hypothetical protein